MSVTVTIHAICIRSMGKRMICGIKDRVIYVIMLLHKNTVKKILPIAMAWVVETTASDSGHIPHATKGKFSLLRKTNCMCLPLYNYMKIFAV